MRTTILDEEDWLDRRYYGGDLPATAERSLHAAALHWHDESVAEGHIHDALTEAPDHIAVLIAAYKFYFYRHRLREALPYAEACLAHCLRQNNLPADWRALTPADVAVAETEPRMLLFCLVARGYVLARLGETAPGRETLSKVSELDPADLLGARRLLAILDRPPELED